MTANSPSAYTLSLVLHTGFVALLFVGAFVIREGRLLEKKPHIFELVAGEGDNYDALEAPALGTPGGSKVELPPIPEVKPAPEPPQPQPPQPEASPVKPAPIEAVKPEKPKPVKKELSMAEKVEKIAARREKKIVDKFRQEQERLAKQRELEAKRLSKEDFDKANRKTGVAGGKGPRIDAEGIAKGVVGGSTRNKVGGAGGKALTREEADRVSEYFSILVSKIRRQLEQEGLDPLFTAEVQVQVASNGALGSPKIIRSSGNPDFDAAVIRAIRLVGAVGRPHPLGRSETISFEAASRDAE
ncbi:TonB C-terminal domain-containing protein [Nibricoccus sp. IMCC34717]|uniref:TonB C-terminal domain-containing protein n=1 Tax=Nibricoccus sp. IMCC34717 TaxID=3034021 RepID=UPI0038515395